MKVIHALVAQQLPIQQIARVDQLLLLGRKPRHTQLQVQVGLVQLIIGRFVWQFDRFGGALNGT